MPKSIQVYCPACGVVSGKTPSASPDKCPRCARAAVGDIIKALRKVYHENCFVCHKCSGPFPNDSFVVVGGNPYCDSCERKGDYF